MTQCQAYGCNTYIHAGGLLCQRHLTLVPKRTMRALEQCQHAPESVAFKVARAEAIKSVHDAERRAK
jgi:hypothetical protein